VSRAKKRTRRVPQRTCVACREVQGKRSLIRIVSSVNGGVQLDLTGKQSGRGAYLCAKRSCFELALEQRRLEHSLRSKLSDADRETLVEFCRDLPADADDQGE